jgi:hypothetical protein
MAARIDRWRGRRREKSMVERAPLGEELGGEGATRKDREQPPPLKEIEDRLPPPSGEIVDKASGRGENEN